MGVSTNTSTIAVASAADSKRGAEREHVGAVVLTRVPRQRLGRAHRRSARRPPCWRRCTTRGRRRRSRWPHRLRRAPPARPRPPRCRDSPPGRWSRCRGRAPPGRGRAGAARGRPSARARCGRRRSRRSGSRPPAPARRGPASGTIGHHRHAPRPQRVLRERRDVTAGGEDDRAAVLEHARVGLGHDLESLHGEAAMLLWARPSRWRR